MAIHSSTACSAMREGLGFAAAAVRVAAEPKRHDVARQRHRAKYQETPETSRVSKSVCVEIRTLAMAFSRTRPSLATSKLVPKTIYLELVIFNAVAVT